MIDLAGDGKCVVCDSYVRPCTLVRICDECNYGSFEVNCVVSTQERNTACGNTGRNERGGSLRSCIDIVRLTLEMIVNRTSPCFFFASIYVDHKYNRVRYSFIFSGRDFRTHCPVVLFHK